MEGIDPEKLAAWSVHFALPVPIRHVAVTTSTNDDVRAWARSGAPHGAALVAEEQTAGRGRLGRRWEGVAGGSVLLSILIRSRLLAHQAPLLALAAAVGTAAAIGSNATIKWPNDVLDREGHKLAGILAELESSAPVVAVLGIGVNARAAPSLAAAGFVDADLERAALAARLVREVLDAVSLLESSVEELLDRWRARAAFLGREVVVGGRRGRMVDVDSDGALVLDAPDGRIRILAGDVALVSRIEESG